MALEYILHKLLNILLKILPEIFVFGNLLKPVVHLRRHNSQKPDVHFQGLLQQSFKRGLHSDIIATDVKA